MSEPRDPRSWWQKLFRKPAESSAESGAYRQLSLQLNHDLPRGSGERSVLLLSPVEKEDCALGAMELAFSLGEELRHPVLLIDACLGDPSLSRALNCETQPGWAELLRDPELHLPGYTLATNSEFVHVLPAGNDRTGSAFPETAAARMNDAQKHFDTVVLSGGAVLQQSSGLALAAQAGCVLLLVAENETLLEDLKAARETLNLCGARNVRLVLTNPVKGGASLRREIAPIRVTRTETLRASV